MMQVVPERHRKGLYHTWYAHPTAPTVPSISLTLLYLLYLLHIAHPTVPPVPIVQPTRLLRPRFSMLWFLDLDPDRALAYVTLQCRTAHDLDRQFMIQMFRARHILHLYDPGGSRMICMIEGMSTALGLNF